MTHLSKVNLVSQPAVLPTNVLIFSNTFNIQSYGESEQTWCFFSLVFQISLVGFMHVEVEMTFVFGNFIFYQFYVCGRIYRYFIFFRFGNKQIRRMWSARVALFSYQLVHSTRLK